MMEPSTIECRVIAAVAAAMGVAPAGVMLSSTQDDIETWDSAGMVNLAMVLESEFRVTLSEDDVAQLTSVRLVLEILRKNGVK